MRLLNFDSWSFRWVNLGTGEPVLLSEQRLRVDDLAWHLIEMYCVKDHVSLVIDKHYEMTGQITGGMHNLHFQHGIYIAGPRWTWCLISWWTAPNFRGCMEDVVFNQREILSSLRSYPGLRKFMSVTRMQWWILQERMKPSISLAPDPMSPSQSGRSSGDGLFGICFADWNSTSLALFQSGREGDFVALEAKLKVFWRLM